ncbi:helix-turn-helix domain-containing protein [Paracoccus litorisediminis]|uniref:helix-turn-helix domain-containing protein n=1 Tax=Paracoccus litorisediminis TaxID=2006130 RepID=UPI003730BB08
MIETPNAIAGAVEKYAGVGEKFSVQGRGRPERHPVDAARRALRREKFGRELRELRIEAGLTLQTAADTAGLSSARKLAQYETTCYPPGEVLISLAPIYGTTQDELGWKLLRHSDPALYRSIRGEEGYEPTDLEIQHYRDKIATM